MPKIPQKWQKAALVFALDIAQEREHFPKKVLSLLDKHFGFSRSIFFPYGDMQEAKQGFALKHYIAYGIPHGPMQAYKTRVFRDDIFHHKSLSPHLKRNRVVFTDDIMPFLEYEKTPYGIHMLAMDMYYQACIYLFAGDRVVASVALLRSKEEGAFQEEERLLLDYLCKLLEGSYQQFLLQTGEAKVLDDFHLFFEDMNLGATMLNQELTVVQANSRAKEIGNIYWEQLRNTGGRFLRSSDQVEQRYQFVQAMVNEISELILTKHNLAGDNDLLLPCVGGEIHFQHSSFLSASVTGAIQTWHILTMKYKSKQLPQDLGGPYNSLTQQERRITYYLATGMKNEDIAQELHISIYTVRTHIANIYKKFEVSNKVDLLMAMQPYLQKINEN